MESSPDDSPVHEGRHRGSVGVVVLLLLWKLNHSVASECPASSHEHPTGSGQSRGTGR